LITNTGFNPDGTVAVLQRQPGIRPVSDAEPRSTLLSRSAATSLSRSFDDFAESINVSPESREPLRTLASAIDMLLLTNSTLMPLITEHLEEARTGDLIEFICKFNTVVDLFSPEFSQKVMQAMQDVSKCSYRIFATGADGLRAKALTSLMRNAYSLTNSVSVSRATGDRGQEWFRETREYNLCILKAIRDFRMAEQR
jgi:hypothetical protein